MCQNSVGATTIAPRTKSMMRPRRLFLLAAILCGVAAPLTYAQDDVTKKQLAAIWASQQTEIVTARIKYRLFQTGSDLAPLTSEQLHNLVSTVDLAVNPDDLRKLVMALSGSKAHREMEKPWGTLEFF